MDTPLKGITLEELCRLPIMLDANILMVGIEDKTHDPNCSFENMKNLYINPLFQSFPNIIIHEKVFNELDSERKSYVDSCKNVQKVSEGGLYGKDPIYTTIFNDIANHERVRYKRMDTFNCGEVFSLAYAAFNNINCFSSKDVMVDEVARELKNLKDIRIITFDVIVLLAFAYHNSRKVSENNKALKSIYKKFCEDVIKRHKLPLTLAEYIKACEEYL